MVKMSKEASIRTRDLQVLTQESGNIYKTVRIVAERAKNLADTSREELNQKLSEFATGVDNLEEIFENKEQIEISKYYEKLPKPSMLALEEYVDGKLFSRIKDK